MFVEQIIEFELRGPGPLVVHAILKLGVFLTNKDLHGKYQSHFNFDLKTFNFDSIFQQNFDFILTQTVLALFSSEF